MKSNYNENHVLYESPTPFAWIMPILDIPKINRIGVDHRYLRNMTEFQGLLTGRFLYRSIFWSTVCGYLVGKAFGRSATGMAIGFSAAILARYAVDSVMKENGLLQDVLITKKVELEVKKRNLTQPTTSTQTETIFRAKNIDSIELKTESIEDLVDNLPLSYFS